MTVNPVTALHKLLACFLLIIASILPLAGFCETAATNVCIEEKFDGPLSDEWSWGLGTWTAKDGVLSGFESGARRHGPVKMRKFQLRDGTVECEFRLTGKANFAGIIFNGSPERGHIVHLVMAKDKIRILAHSAKGEGGELLSQPNALAVGKWHSVKIEFKGPVVTATVDRKTFTAQADCIGEEKLTFGLGGDSGGPEGEQAGTLEFRELRATSFATVL